MWIASPFLALPSLVCCRCTLMNLDLSMSFFVLQMFVLQMFVFAFTVLSLPNPVPLNLWCLSNTCIFLFFPLDQYFITLLEVIPQSVFDSFLELFQIFNLFSLIFISILFIYIKFIVPTKSSYFQVCRSKISQEIKRLKRKNPYHYSCTTRSWGNLSPRSTCCQMPCLCSYNTPRIQNFPYDLASHYFPLCVCSNTFLC